jgi:hypothetical protein
VSFAACPRCGTATADGQEYCIECGLRLSRRSLPEARAGRVAVLVSSFVVAAAGAAVAIAVTWDDSSTPGFVTATGGSILPPTTGSAETDLTLWPAKRDGWTVVLVSIPKKDGREVATSRAAEAAARGLPDVGVIDSSRVPSLHPGYWVVFSGIYDTQPEATSVLVRARTVAKGADARRIAAARS